MKFKIGDKVIINSKIKNYKGVIIDIKTHSSLWFYLLESYDDPINEAVEGIVNGIFFNQGHVGNNRWFSEGDYLTLDIQQIRIDKLNQIGGI